MNFLTIKETARRWGVSERTVNALCSSGRVDGAGKFGNAWAIPENAEKPSDPRKKNTQVTINAPLNCEEKSNPADELRIAMPLLNTPYKLGDALGAVNKIADFDQRQIALAEYYYFSGQAQRASEIAEPYLTHEDTALAVSACWLYAYSNLSLDRVIKAKEAMALINRLRDSISEESTPRDRALITCVSTGVAVFLHLPLPKILTPLKTYIHMMPPGLRLFILYIEAHHSYLNKYYGAAIGIAETALALEGQIYPIPNIYLHLVACMGYMNLKQPEEAKKHLLEAWELARPDDMIQALGEHHGLLGGALEATVKKEFPEDFKRIIGITYKFSSGWRKIHNNETGNTVADNLTTTEFAAAMLAARNWTNQEISAHMGISEYTVRHYISTALQKLNISQRKELAKFMLK